MSSSNNNKSQRQFIVVEDKDRGKFQQVNNVLENYQMTSAGATYRDGKFFAFLFVRTNDDNEEDEVEK
jgi:hypothetical protein